MRVTLQYIERKFQEYNQLCFEGKLKPVPFKLSMARTFLGRVCCKQKRNPDGTWHYSGFIFRISTQMDLPENVIEDTILHEMIHYYILSNQMQDTAPHGELFMAKMDEINTRFNRNLSVAHKYTKEDHNNDKEIRVHLICVSRLKTDQPGTTIAARSRLFRLWDAMPRFPKIANLQWIVSTNTDFNRFPRALSPKIYHIPAEELEEHLKGAKN